MYKSLTTLIQHIELNENQTKVLYISINNKSTNKLLKKRFFVCIYFITILFTFMHVYQ